LAWQDKVGLVVAIILLLHTLAAVEAVLEVLV
jgi:hypothetical protein